MLKKRNNLIVTADIGFSISRDSDVYIHNLAKKLRMKLCGYLASRSDHNLGCHGDH